MRSGAMLRKGMAVMAQAAGNPIPAARCTAASAAVTVAKLAAVETRAGMVARLVVKVTWAGSS